jgi:hypothetical protein
MVVVLEMDKVRYIDTDTVIDIDIDVDVDVDVNVDVYTDTETNIFERKNLDIRYRTASILGASDVKIYFNIDILSDRILE